MTHDVKDMSGNKAKMMDLAGPTIFIDGEAGTTGLQIAERLQALKDIDVISIDPELRKDSAARQDMMRQADVVVLCLPDAAAREAVALAEELGDAAPRVLDASTAHRVVEGWIYGFAELAPDQSEAIAGAQHVANPGCYPTGAIALLRPLVDAGLVPQDYPITINAVSGYSGGGRQMIEAYERGEAPPFELYGLHLKHKHLPEIEHYSGLSRQPIFVPSVGNFRQGMAVSVPLHLDQLPGTPSAEQLLQTLVDRYKDSDVVRVVEESGRDTLGGRLNADMADTDHLELYVFQNDAGDQAVLVARLDNLGKGAAGAAVQNLRLMLGL